MELQQGKVQYWLEDKLDHLLDTAGAQSGLEVVSPADPDTAGVCPEPESTQNRVGRVLLAGSPVPLRDKVLLALDKLVGKPVPVVGMEQPGVELDKLQFVEQSKEVEGLVQLFQL